MVATKRRKKGQQHGRRRGRDRDVRLWPVLAMGAATGALVWVTVAGARRSLRVNGYVHVDLMLVIVEAFMVVMTVWMAVKRVQSHRQ